ncbi:Down syndrome critical region protein 3 homolog isoform X2 [Pomacea canaliculata]|uniref:Down syndrome critical region protein 3 homolog isoform X2 n=1 Tax=Pomacea canaliculata TaxID=400727 RepID=UPI000D73C463|nr:Down syndrome critical region protein 3 homolog isoform X2 [Pomacea canaliculata]
MAMLDIRLKRVSKIYKEGDVVSGLVVVQSKGEVQHQGISLVVEGIVNLQLSAKSVGVFEAFYNSIKPIQVLHYPLEIAKPGRLPSGKTEIPFEIPLKPKPGKTLYETYHGVFVNIQDQEERAKAKPVSFTISPETLVNVKEKQNIPRFKVKGKLESSCIQITKPLKGELTVEQCDAPIKSIEIQLVRVETCGCAEGYAKDATEIQNIQIAEGDVCRNLPIPIYMVFPRLFTCPTLSTNNFKVEFEINIVIIFSDDHLVTENFPVKLTRF